MRTAGLTLALLASYSRGQTTQDFPSLAQCASSWNSYAAFTSAAVTYVTNRSTTYFPVMTNITSGTGQVHTTLAGIPVASGSFSPTKVVRSIINVTTWYPTQSITSDPARYQATPSCSFPGPSDCSSLYVSYLNSLGLSSNASVPRITPTPTNSPQCPEYYYRPNSNCSIYRDHVGTCYLSGANVQVFYFPSKSEVARIGTNTARVIQSYSPGITFTSPSIYLSFDYLSAVSTLAALESSCMSCGWDGCLASAVGGGDAIQTRGTSVAGALLTLAPEDVSTLLVSYPQSQVSSVVHQIAHGGPDFANLAFDINYRGEFMARRLNIEHFVHPRPEDYYLRPEGAPGCNDSFATPECSTIFEAMHRPILSLPSQVSLLQGAWATCEPAVYGVYDPPMALNEESTIEGVPGFEASTTFVPTHAVTTPPAVSVPWEEVLPPTNAPVSEDGVPVEQQDALQSSTDAGPSSTVHDSTLDTTSATNTIHTPSATGTSMAVGLLDDHYAALVIALIGVMILL